MGQRKKDFAIWVILIAILAGLACALWYGSKMSDQGKSLDQEARQVVSNSPAGLTNQKSSNVIELSAAGNATNTTGAKSVTPSKARTPVFYGK